MLEIRRSSGASPSIADPRAAHPATRLDVVGVELEDKVD